MRRDNGNLAWYILRFFSSFYIRLFEKVKIGEVIRLDNYLKALSGFRQGDYRMILPFRHTAKADAPVLAALFGNHLPARFKVGDRRFWIHFLYGDMVLDWAGSAAKWIFPRLEALPVSNQKLAKKQMDSIRELLFNGKYPLSMAPEGQVNYYFYKSGPFTDGLTHFIRWINRQNQKVLILPIKIHYRYKEPEKIVSRVLARVNRLTPSRSKTLEEAILSILQYIHRYLIGSASPFKDSRFLVEEISRVLRDRAAEVFPLPNPEKPLDTLFLFRHYVFQDLRKGGYTVPGISRRIRLNWQFPEKLTQLERMYQYNQILDILLNFDPDYHLDKEIGRAHV